MAELAEIIQFIAVFLDKQSAQPLKGKTALVSAGPTYERLDPVRYIGNFSTGKMGIALAEELARLGAKVSLVLGPTHLRSTHPTIHTVLVESAEEMYHACDAAFVNSDITIMAAAVADYKPKNKSEKKIKKADDALEISLEKNKDILAHLGQVKAEGQILVGFALETDNEMANALQKLKKKNADFIVLNSLQDVGAGFGSDNNKVTIIAKDGRSNELPLMSKVETAAAIIQTITNIH